MYQNETMTLKLRCVHLIEKVTCVRKDIRDK